MPAHVDLIENRWSAGHQERVGRAFEGPHGVEVDTRDDRYRDIVLGSDAAAASNPEQFLRGLASHFHSDYFFANELHDDEDCPFGESNTLPFGAQPVADSAGQR